MTTFVIVGGGLAGAKAAETLRGEGFDGDIVLFGDETERPYERPALSKGYLLGKEERDSVFVHSADWYPEHHADLRLGTPVTAIDRAARSVAFAAAARSPTTSWRSPPAPRRGRSRSRALTWATCSTCGPRRSLTRSGPRSRRARGS